MEASKIESRELIKQQSVSTTLTSIGETNKVTHKQQLPRRERASGQPLETGNDLEPDQKIV